jgi:hypothetical protein
LEGFTASKLTFTRILAKIPLDLRDQVLKGANIWIDAFQYATLSWRYVLASAITYIISHQGHRTGEPAQFQSMLC